MKPLRFPLFLLFVAEMNPSLAQDFESMQVAQELGQLLASEEACGLSFDQDAISAYIEKNVEPGDMSFTGSLNMMTVGSRVQIEEMGKSALTAHCTQVRRAAEAHGFIGN